MLGWRRILTESWLHRYGGVTQSFHTCDNWIFEVEYRENEGDIEHRVLQYDQNALLSGRA